MHGRFEGADKVVLFSRQLLSGLRDGHLFELRPDDGVPWQLPGLPACLRGTTGVLGSSDCFVRMKSLGLKACPLRSNTIKPRQRVGLHHQHVVGRRLATRLGGILHGQTALRIFHAKIRTKRPLVLAAVEAESGSQRQCRQAGGLLLAFGCFDLRILRQSRRQLKVVERCRLLKTGPFGRGWRLGVE